MPVWGRCISRGSPSSRASRRRDSCRNTERRTGARAIRHERGRQRRRRGPVILAGVRADISRREPAHTRDAYLRDIGVLKALAGGPRHDVRLRPATLRRFLADAARARVVGKQPRANAVGLARVLSRFALERDEDSGTILRGAQGAEDRRGDSRGAFARRGRAPGDDRRSDPLAMRDRALFELAYSSGLRLSELSGSTVWTRSDRSGDGRGAGMGQAVEGRIVPVGEPPSRDSGWLAVSPAGISRADDACAFHQPRSGGDYVPRAIRAAARWRGRSGAGSSRMSIRTCCATRSHRTCCSRPATCARCRRCSATRASRARRSTPHLDFQHSGQGLRRRRTRAQRRAEGGYALPRAVRSASDDLHRSRGSHGRSVTPGSMPACLRQRRELTAVVGAVVEHCALAADRRARQAARLAVDHARVLQRAMPSHSRPVWRTLRRSFEHAPDRWLALRAVARRSPRTCRRRTRVGARPARRSGRAASGRAHKQVIERAVNRVRRTAPRSRSRSRSERCCAKRVQPLVHPAVVARHQLGSIRALISRTALPVVVHSARAHRRAS